MNSMQWPTAREIIRPRAQQIVSGILGLGALFILSGLTVGASYWSGTAFGQALFAVGALLALAGLGTRSLRLAGIGVALCTKTLSLALLVALASAAASRRAGRPEVSAGDGEAVPEIDFGGEILSAGGVLFCLGLVKCLDLLHRAQVLPTYFLIP